MASTRALLTVLNVYLADNNVRRTIGAFSANFNNANQNFQQIDTLVLAAGGTYNFTAVAGNLITVVATNVTLSANVALAGGGGWIKNISSLLVVDFEVTSIAFTNNDPINNATLFIASA